MGDPSHPVYGRADRGLVLQHSFTRGPANTPLGQDLG